MKNLIRNLVLGLAMLAPVIPLQYAFAQDTVITYQGRVTDNGTNFAGMGQFKFALVTGTNSAYTTFWSNDGTSEGGGQPTTAVPVPVSGGLFTVALGEIGLTNMTGIPVSVFNQANLELEIWFSDGVDGFALLTPLQYLTPAPYAVVASNLVGTLPATQLTGTISSSTLPASPVFSGSVTAGSFAGNGASLTNIPIGALNSGGTLGLTTNGIVLGVSGSNAIASQPTLVFPAINLNGSGLTDLVVTSPSAETVIVLTNTGSGTYGVATNLPTLDGPACVAVADLNNDGRPDLAVVNQYNNSVEIFTNMGGGQFRSNQTVTVGSYPGWVAAVTNLSGAGKTGLLVSQNTGGGVLVLTNNGAGVMSSNSFLTAGESTLAIAVADFNGDSYPDFAVAVTSGNTVIVFTNNTQGGFGSNATLTLGTSPSVVLAQDMNGDGTPDLVCSSGGSTVGVLTNHLGTLTLASNIVIGQAVFGLALGNFFNDGQMDIAVNFEGNNLILVQNMGGGKFAAPLTMSCLPENIDIEGIAAVGVSGQSLPEIVAAVNNEISGNTYYLVEFQNEIGATSAGLQLQSGGLRLATGWTGVPDLIGGSEYNMISPGTAGSIIAGGGSSSSINSIASDNSVIGGGTGNGIIANASYSVIGGGYQNTNAGAYAVLGGGDYNIITSYGSDSFLGGGSFNSNGASATFLGGGSENIVSGATASLVGGYGNTASGYGSFVGGGGTTGSSYAGNTASAGASVVAGGLGNTASGTYSTVPGGAGNLAGGNYSFAAGQQAHATNTGTFVWADSSNAAFASTSSNQFLIRAGGGVGINTNNPTTALSVNGTVSATSFSGNGSGLSNTVTSGSYIFAYDTATQTIATANTAQTISFANVPVSNTWTHASSSAPFVCGVSGIYLVQYTATAASSTASAVVITLGLNLNGAAVAGSQISIEATNMPTSISKSVLVSATAAQTLTFQVTGSTTAAELTPYNGNPSVSCTIVRIQ